MDFEVVTADITTLEVDAIVNAANNRMRGGGGVDGAIHRAAGRGLLRECEERFPRGLATGDAGWTTGHRLPARWVIHVVGPVHDGIGRNRDRLVSCYANALASCYRRSLEVADELGARSVAFPAISTGIYGYPAEEAAAIAVATLRRATTDVEVVTLVAFDDRTLSLYRRLLEDAG